MANNNSSILENLNERQKEAVLHFKGPLLIIAGAGSGKTKVLTHRIAYLMEKGIEPKNILAVTFTNKAAEEMRKRILKLSAGSKEFPFIGTFHSLGARILRENGGAIGISKNFSIMDEEDSLTILKNVIKELRLDPKQYQASRIKDLISRKKGELLNFESLKESNDNFFIKIFAQIWELYEKNLESQKALDFDDLIQKTAALLKTQPKILKDYQDKWQFINIDEYQDTNYAQYELTKTLASKHKNICAIGDIDQSIYSWRGADFRNILNFERDYPEVKIITLEENYRSTQKILEAANAIIIKNKERLPKNLFTKKGTGENICLFEAADEKMEAEFIASETENLISDNLKPSNIAVLYRTNFQSRIIEEEFLKKSVPYQVVGVKFYDRKEIKDILAYLRFSLNPNDMISLKRIINVPSRNIGKSLFLKYLTKNDLNQKEKEKINNFEKTIKDIAESINTQKASSAIKFLLRRSGYSDSLKDKTEESEMRLANIKEMATIATKLDSLESPLGIEQLLTEAALMSEQDTLKDKKEGVKLMTVHAAKGLEFDCVFIAGLEDGLFPHSAAESNPGLNRQEEERRLFYVALTRAKEKLFLSFAFTRTIFGSRQINRPSRFLLDIPPELLKSADNMI